MKKLLYTLALVLMLGVSSCTTSPQLIVTWTPPVEGSPSVEYIISVLDENGNWVPLEGTFISNRSYRIDMATTSPGKVLLIKVAGIDGLGRQGYWSPISDPYEVKEK